MGVPADLMYVILKFRTFCVMKHEFFFKIRQPNRYPSMYLVTISEHYLCCLPAGVQDYVRNQRGFFFDALP